MKMVKTTHRSGGKPYTLPKTYNRPGTSKNKAPEHATHCKGSKKHK